MFSGGAIYLLMKMANKQAVIFTLGIFIFFFTMLFMISMDYLILFVDILLVIFAILVSLGWREKNEK